MLLQLVTGKPACDNLRDKVSYHIADWVRLKLDSGELDEILDINLRSTTYNHKVLLQMTRLKLRCTDLGPSSCPSMSHVVQELELGFQAVDELYSNLPSAAISQTHDIIYNGSGYTCKSSGSDFNLLELRGKDAHIKFDGMEWIDMKFRTLAMFLMKRALE